MKLTKPEWAALAVTAAALAAMVFYTLFAGRQMGQVRILTRSVEQSSLSAGAAQEPAQAEEETEAQPQFPLDLNRATVEELMHLPGIGQVRAKAIVAYREENGPFRYVEDLRSVPGIGEGTLAQVMDYVTIGD